MQDAMKSYEETTKVNEIKINQELEDVFVKIHESINNGIFYVFDNGVLNGYTVHVLQKLGYEVKNNIDGTNNYFICWLDCGLFNDDFSLSRKHIQNKSTNNSGNHTENKANKRKFPIFWR